jgi:tape measure domain-containing protein|nr:MAG TPA: Tape measure domain protein [Caudoviricetes sp.]
MAELGKGYINVIPKFPGLSSSITSALNGVNTSQVGAKWGTSIGQGMSGSLVKSGAVVGVFSSLTNKAISAVTTNLGAAISRFDTLNNYPRVMESLSFSADAANESVTKMSDHLTGLPTALNDMTSTVQGLSVITKDLDLATNAGLALNDMLLASGSSQQLASAAMEQFRQMLSKGKPDMQDWKSLVQAMPGQLDQLAKSMLGSTADANALYAALGGGKNKATISMTDLLNAMVKLDKEGGESFASFEEQARNATDGIETSAANMGTAMARGIAGVFDAVGKDNISGGFKDITSGINAAFSVIQDVVRDAAPQIKEVASALTDIAPAALAAGGGIMALQGAGNVLGVVASKGKQFAEASRLAAGGAGTLSESLKATGAIANPAGLALGIAGAAAGFLALQAYEAYQRQQNLEMATKGLSQAVSDTAALSDYAGTIDGLGSSSSKSSESIDELNASIASHAKAMQDNVKEAQAQIAELNTYQDVIEKCAGRTDLSVQEQGELEYAIRQVNEQFGLNISAADVAAGKYTDQNGKVQNLISSLDALIQKKKEEVEADVQAANYKEALEAKSEAEKAYAKAVKERDEAQKVAADTEGKSAETIWANNKAVEDANKKVEDATKVRDEATDSADRAAEALGDVGKSVSDSADKYDEWGNKTSGAFRAILEEGGTSVTMLKDDLRTLGVDTASLSRLTESELEQLALSYDGSISSIFPLLSEYDVKMDGAAKNTAQNAQEIASAFDGFKSEVQGALDGIDTNAFSDKLASAGVSSESFKNLSAQNIADLASQCNYDIDTIVATIKKYNDLPVEEKNGKILIEDGSIVVSQEHVNEWNDTEPKSYEASAKVDGNLPEANNQKNAWNSGGLKNWQGSAVINITRSINDVVASVFPVKNASGGIRLNAEGGYRFHADGAIATKATPLDIVGEDGAEAIVPLTNRKYSQPFIDLLAEGIDEKFGDGGRGGNTYVTIHLAVGADSSAKDITRAIAREIKLHGLMR